MSAEPLVAAAPYLIEQKYQDYTPAQHAVGLNWSAGGARRWMRTPAGSTSKDMKLSDCRTIVSRILVRSAIESDPEPAGAQLL